MKRHSGFSLVEVIVSAALIASAVGALFATSSMAIRLSTLAQDRLIASELAREGIAIVSQIRDSNFAIDSCTGSALTCHQSWTTGILGVGETLPLTRIVPKQVIYTPNSSVPYSLATVTTGDCTDYLVRDTNTGGITDDTTMPILTTSEQLFCRRIFIEPVTSVTGGSDVNATNAIRVRSQVAWLDAGKKQLQTLGAVAGQGTAATCLGVTGNQATTEWCTEQVTILTDWQQPL